MKNNRIRKVLALIIAMSMLTAFTACGGDDKDKGGSETQNVSFSDTGDGESDSYKVTAETYESKDGKVKVSYPQISGLDDEAMQNYYNSLFKSDFADLMKEDNSDTFENSYQVTYQTDDMLSIVFRCSLHMDGAAHPMAYAYAYTIDLKTGGTLVPSKDIDLDSAANGFSSGESWELVKAADGVSKSDVMESYADTDTAKIKEYITETDVVTVTKNENGEYSKSGTMAGRSYLDESGAPVFILDVTHALGDYIEIKFN